MRNTKKLRVAIQMDALKNLNVAVDSTLCIALAAARRGYEIFHYEAPALRMDIDGKKTRVTAKGHTLKFKGAEQASAYCDKERIENMVDFDIILMRQDPPFDLAYISASHILEHVQHKVRILNDPSGTRNAPEKLFATLFPEFMPPTLITKDCEAVKDFRKRHNDIIVKHLHGFAGHGVFHVKPDDDNLPALLETLIERNNEPWMIQKYLPEIQTKGDKRIVMLDGDPVGVFTRIPAKGDLRGNMRVGAQPKKAPLTARDREICAALAPVLREQGLYLVGIDVIGDYLTEINVTSPTGLVVADRLAGRKGKDTIAEQFWDRLDK
jgi:glutathione synthase